MELPTIEIFGNQQTSVKGIKVSYSLNRRPGQSRIAAIYQEVIGRNCSLVADQDQADVVIVHHPPKNYVTSYALHPQLREKYVIAYCVPHAESIPRSWASGLRLVQEVWTCSEYCREVLAKWHPNVVRMPYVIQRAVEFSDEARACVQRFLAYDPKLIYFLCIAPLDEPRKNVEGLVRAFKAVCKKIPNARLVLKGSPEDRHTWENDNQILFLPVNIPHEYVNALYTFADVYVSAHHCEGWGLTLSDALLFKKPVVAPDYSGCLEFLNAENAYLVPVQKSAVPANAIGVAIEEGLGWATPDEGALANCFVSLSASIRSPEVTEKVRRGQDAIDRFSPGAVERLIMERILAAFAFGLRRVQ